MIYLIQRDWADLAEHFLDDSAGPVDDMPFSVEIVDHNMVILHFADPAEETMFRLRWLNM